MLNRRLLLLASVSALLTAGSARADAADTAQALVEKLSRELVGVVNGPGSATDKQAALEKLIDRDVDIPTVARFCLGRFWRTATPDQLKAYGDLFRAVLVKNITSKVGEYQGVTMTVGKAQAREEDVLVGSVVTRPNNAPNRVDWVVSAASGAPRIIDVVAEGTSLRLTQRSDYSAFLVRNSNDVQALIDAMRRQASQPG
ncbi:MAG: ABC transporter substrate-binding protein [Alphaproteobacteria bacterium]|nr:ABC transporter substrate-binding protein [Alphaproteobacteria bacterium]